MHNKLIHAKQSLGPPAHLPRPHKSCQRAHACSCWAITPWPRGRHACEVPTGMRRPCAPTLRSWRSAVRGCRSLSCSGTMPSSTEQYSAKQYRAVSATAILLIPFHHTKHFTASAAPVECGWATWLDDLERGMCLTAPAPKLHGLSSP